jgi:hypothetical protein
MTVIRLSYVRATFAADLLAGVRSSLLRVTDLLDGELDLAHSTHRRSGTGIVELDPVDTSAFVAAALYAGWISDALKRQIAFYFELDNRLAGTLTTSQLPPTESPPKAPAEWPQPPMPEPVGRMPNPLAGMAESSGQPQPREHIMGLLADILEDLDDAIKAINWSRNVRFQAEIADAATNLRAWVEASADAIAADG